MCVGLAAKAGQCMREFARSVVVLGKLASVNNLPVLMCDLLHDSLVIKGPPYWSFGLGQYRIETKLEICRRYTKPKRAEIDRLFAVLLFLSRAGRLALVRSDFTVLWKQTGSMFTLRHMPNMWRSTIVRAEKCGGRNYAEQKSHGIQITWEHFWRTHVGKDSENSHGHEDG